MQADHATTQLPADSLSRVVAAVFRRAEYRRSIRRTLAEDIIEWVSSLFRSIASSIEAHPVLRILLVASALALVLVIIGRLIYARGMIEVSHSQPHSLSIAGDIRDPWSAAQAAALSGNYLDAAHFLYHTVLQGLARSDRVIIESSKTVGDYSRELRRSSSPALRPYRDFARLYEPIVWGTQKCGNDEYMQLRQVAAQLSGRVA
ncbi:MAG TPA: DUF4129 domain-containing protein [Gemmatimonadaceae bacterium]